MPDISVFSYLSFIILVGVVAAAFIIGTRKSGTKLSIAIVIIAVWLIVPALLAQSGLLARFEQSPPPLMILIGILTLTTVGVAFSGIGTRLVDGIDIKWLVGFQAFRLPLELLLHRLFQENIVPVQMTYAGRNFDIVTGIMATAIFIWGMKSRPPRWIIQIFNLVGLALLINIVSIAILSMPTPMRRFFNEPANDFVAYFPFVWLPAFLVQAAWFGHFLVFRWLVKSRSKS